MYVSFRVFLGKDGDTDVVFLSFTGVGRYLSCFGTRVWYGEDGGVGRGRGSAVFRLVSGVFLFDLGREMRVRGCNVRLVLN